MKNIITSWITSLFGFILMALAVYDFYQDKELGYNIVILFLGLILLRMKDAWVGKLFAAFVKKFLGIFLLLAIFSTSCVTQKKCYQRFPPEVKTEITKEVVIERHDSIITQPADSSHIKALIECDSLGNAYIKQITELENGTKVKQRIKIVDNYLTADCVVDSNAIAIAWNETHTKETKIEKEIAPPIIEKVTWWRKLMNRFRSFFEVSGYILWIGLIILGVKKFVLKM